MAAQGAFLGAQLKTASASVAKPASIRRSTAVSVSARQTKTNSKAAGAQYTVDVDKPTGLSLAQSSAEGGGLVVKSAGGNAAAAGIKNGDTVIYASSFFGDELWPADKLGFVNNALKAAPSPVTLVLVRGENKSVNVKRLPKKDAPAKLYNRKLTEGQRDRATHICVDCGYVYTDELPFDSTKENYRCPQCLAPKRRFVPYDVRSGQAKGMAEGTIGTAATVIGGLIGIAVLVYLAQSV